MGMLWAASEVLKMHRKTFSGMSDMNTVLLRNVQMTTFINLLLPPVRVHLYVILYEQFLHPDFSHLR